MAKLETRKLTDLKQDFANANAGSERGLRILDDSLQETGLGRSIVTDKNGVIIGGNKTHERAVDRGFEDALIVHTSGNELVVVQRDDLDLSDPDPNNKARKLAYFDNRSSELGLSWDAQQIAADLEAGVDLSYAFTEGELAAITNQGDYDPIAEWQGMPEFEQKTLKPFHSLILHLNTEQDMNDFAILISQTVLKTTRYLYYPKLEKEKMILHRVQDES